MKQIKSKEMKVDNIGDFSRLDNANKPDWFINFMDFANSIPEYYEINKIIANELGNLSGKRVLDFGSGTGDDAKLLFDFIDNISEVVGVDASDRMLEEARKRSVGSKKKISFIKTDGETLPFNDNFFDAARAKLVLSHCNNIDNSINELIRVIRPGGRLVIFEYDFDTMTIDHDNKLITREIIRRYSDAHKNNWVGRTFFSKFKKRELKNIKIIPYTVILPFEFLEILLSGLLSSSSNGDDTTEKEIIKWWLEIKEKNNVGDFFASLGGFLVSGCIPE